MVAEDELDSEVEQANIIKQKIGQCIMDIYQVLDHASTHEVTDTASAEGGTSCITPPKILP